MQVLNKIKYVTDYFHWDLFIAVYPEFFPGENSMRLVSPSWL